MGVGIANVFDGLSRILCMCPCCGDLFYVSEAHPFLKGKQPHSVVDKFRATERRLEKVEEELDENETELRARSALAGERRAKKLLKKIDPLFSGSGYDPQDVKVIFDPVSYVIFDGMANDCVDEIVLLAKEAEDTATERIHKSIAKAIQNGNLEFRTLHVNNEGLVSSI